MIDYDAIVARRWDDNLIREAFIDDGGFSEYHNPISGAKENRRVMGAIFDAWLRSVKAKVWDEGFDAGERDVFEHETFDEPCIKNPYREADG